MTRDSRYGWVGGAIYDWSGGYNASFAAGALAGMVNLTLVGALIWALYRRRPVPASEAG